MDFMQQLQAQVDVWVAEELEKMEKRPAVTERLSNVTMKINLR